MSNLDSKPKFNPAKPFQTVDAPPDTSAEANQAKPKFDASKPFQAVDTPDTGVENSKKPAYEPTSPAESAMRGAAQGATFGLADEGAAGIIGTLDYLQQGGKLPLKDYIKIRKDLIRKQDDKAKEDNPASYTAGDVAGSVATTAVPGLGTLNAGLGAGIGEMAGKSAVSGLLSGYGRSSEDTLSGQAKDALKGASSSAILGAGLAGIPSAVRGANSAIQNVSSRIEDAGGKTLAGTVMGATLGHIFGYGSMGGIVGGAAGPVMTKLGQAAYRKLEQAGPGAEVYLDQFKDAIQRGTAGALHQELINTDPKYRALISNSN